MDTNALRMPRGAAQFSDPGADAAAVSPLYARVTGVLQQALVNGSIPTGAVLLEGHIADILRVTRTPVRHALQELEAAGLLSRFEGRGLVAGPSGTAPRRVALTAAMLGVDAAAEPVRKTLGWEAIYQEVERDVVHLAVFQTYRINELELARHFSVGRTVARDVLLRLESLGLVEKDHRQRWAVTPLDRDRIGHLYELRWWLEPAALEAAMARAPAAETAAMAARLDKAARAYPRVRRDEMDRLERDLHVTLLAHCPNRPLLESLQRTRCILTLSKHVLGAAAPMPQDDPFLAEHRAVLDAVAGGDAARARGALQRHLEASCTKVVQRAAFVREHLATPNVPYAG
ncbi:GntR family transcriptional regulator [Xylophilus sp.]|uniref:GntR family transcriptional regulator n=1 Tax=Xylophilus sp. TaxID=2653893 RepID=UPI002D7E2AB9|nr:GntR family transcriptional regulator [Xylophilus sp.]